MTDLDLTGRRIYIAGPMTGIPAFNFPAFDAAADRLREQGWAVINPAQLDDHHQRQAALNSPDGDLAEYARLTGLHHGDFLRRDIGLLTTGTVTDIALLPGWRDSTGAALEAHVAWALGLALWLYHPNTGTLLATTERPHAWLSVPGRAAEGEWAKETAGTDNPVRYVWGRESAPFNPNPADDD